MSFTLAAYNNQLKVSTAKDAVAYSNLFVVDKAMNTYHITIKRGNTSVFTYNFDDQRKYTAHVDVNSEEMERCIQELRTKKRNIYSLGSSRTSLSCQWPICMCMRTSCFSSLT